MKLTLIDFKGYDRQEVELGGITKLSGENGLGKTAILEAILYAYYGRDFYNKVAVDQFIRRGRPGATVLLESPGFTIKRSLGHGTSSLYLNGTRTHLQGAITGVPTAEVAYALVNPLYFLFEMTTPMYREFFMSILPSRSKTEIFKEKYSTDEGLVEQFKLADPDALKARRRAIVASISSLGGAIDSYTQELFNTNREIDAITKALPPVKIGVLEKEKEKQREIDEIDSRLDRLEGNPYSIEEKNELELRDLQELLRPILRKHGVKNLTELLAHLDARVADLQAEISELVSSCEQSRLLISQYEQFESGRCPVCSGDVSEKAVDLIDVRERYNKSLDDLAGLKQKLALYSSASEQALEVSQRVSTLKNERSTIQKSKKIWDRLTKKRDLLRSQLVGFSEEDFKRAVERESQVKLREYYRNRRKVLERSIKSSKDALVIENESLATVNLLIEACSPQGVAAEIAMDSAKLLSKKMTDLMGVDVEVSTVKKNRTNDRYREVFDIRVNGVYFRSLSFGERITLAIAFGLVAREYVESPFNFVLLDEASVLSNKTLEKVKSWFRERGLGLIYTYASSETKLRVESELDNFKEY